jgi:ubiquinol-cytochrome c reductase cytochrome c1 subunit
MKKTLLNLFVSTCMALGLSSGALAASVGIAWDKAPINVDDHASLQNGAKLFVNYCLNCHSAAYMRYNRLKDIGLTDTQIKENLLFTGEKIGELMQASINPSKPKTCLAQRHPICL